MRQIVNALLVRDGAVLLAKRSPARRAYPGSWSFPGGHVEAGETLNDALVREVQEEIGVTPTCFRMLGSIQEPNLRTYDEATYHLYAVSVWEGVQPILIGDEHTELRWVTLDRAGSISGLAMSEYVDFFEMLRRER